MRKRKIKLFGLPLMVMFVFQVLACGSHKPNEYQNEILDWLALPTIPVSNLSYDSSHYDLQRNEVQFYDIAITEGMSPAYMRTVRSQFKDKERCRLLSKVLFCSRYADVIPMFVKADADIRIIVVTDKGEIMEDEIFSPEEYSKTPSKKDVHTVVLNSLKQQAESLEIRLPALIEDGVYIVSVDFDEKNRDFNYYIEVQDAILSQLKLNELQVYADYLAEQMIRFWYENVYDKEITNWYKEINLSFVFTVIDQRGNVLCHSSKTL